MAAVCDLGATREPCKTCGALVGHSPLCGALKARDDLMTLGAGVYFERADGTTEYVPPADWKLP
jgi:hypothetical protein